MDAMEAARIAHLKWLEAEAEAEARTEAMLDRLIAKREALASWDAYDNDATFRQRARYLTDTIRRGMKYENI